MLLARVARKIRPANRRNRANDPQFRPGKLLASCFSNSSFARSSSIAVSGQTRPLSGSTLPDIRGWLPNVSRRLHAQSINVDGVSTSHNFCRSCLPLCRLLAFAMTSDLPVPGPGPNHRLLDHCCGKMKTKNVQMFHKKKISVTPRLSGGGYTEGG